MASFPSSFGTADSLQAASPSVGRRLERIADISLGSGERIFLVIALLFFSGAQVFHLQGYPTDSSKSDPTAYAIQVLVYACFALFLFRDRAIVGRAARYLAGVWMLVAFTYCSATWAQDPIVTVKYSTYLLGTTVFGVYFGTRFDLSEQIRILAVTLGWAVALSVLTGALFPDYGVMAYEPVGTWMGIYSHRNALARMMVLAVLVFMLRKRLGGSRLLNSLGIIAALGLIALSRSATGMFIVVLMFFVLNVSRILRWKRAKKIAAVVAVGAAVIGFGTWFITNWSAAMEMLGRSSTLTGRIPLWIMCGLMGFRKRWLGYGGGEFWRGYEGPSAIVWKVVGWTPPNAHNGFLDIWLSIGLVGLAMFLVFFVCLLWRAIAHIRPGSPPEALWPLSFVIFAFLYNLDETGLFQPNNIVWVLLVAVCVSLCRSKWAPARATGKTI